MNRRRILLLAIMLMTAGIVQAQEARQMSVEDCIAYAIANKDYMKNVRLDEAISKARNSEVTGLALPQVNASGQFQYYIKPQQSFLPGEFFGAPAGTFIPVTFTPKYNSAASLNASQVLFDGSVVVALQARKTLEELARLNVRRSEEDLRAEVSKAYYNILVVYKQLDIMDKTYQDLLRIAGDIEKAYKIGMAEKISVDQAQVEANNLETEKIKLQNIYDLSVLALKYQIGMPLGDHIILTDTISEAMTNPADLLAESSSFDYTQRTDYNLLETQLKLNLLDLKRYRWSGLPSLSASGAYGFNYANNDFDKMFTEPYLKSFYLALGLRVPIFDGLQRRNKVKQAALTVEKTRNTIEGTKQGIDLEQAQARTTLKNNILALENQRKNLTLAKSVFDLADKKYKEGVGSNVELIQAKTSYLQSQSNYFNALNAAITARIDLQKALGLYKQ